jgi:MOSC domain-containing protein YiiM
MSQRTGSESPERPSVVAVSKSEAHTFSKKNCECITLLAGQGVEGDAHAGATVKHRSMVKANAEQPNLRQVHLIHTELLDELKEQGFKVYPGAIGENITTSGIDVLSLPRNTLLRIGPSAVVQVTGLRSPCKQLDNFQDGLKQAVLDRGESGELIRKSGIMGIVIEGGTVRPGDEIVVTLPDGLHQKLDCV